LDHHEVERTMAQPLMDLTPVSHSPTPLVPPPPLRPSNEYLRPRSPIPEDRHIEESPNEPHVNRRLAHWYPPQDIRVMRSMSSISSFGDFSRSMISTASSQVDRVRRYGRDRSPSSRLRRGYPLPPLEPSWRGGYSDDDDDDDESTLR
jgi:hypothetical protein